MFAQTAGATANSTTISPDRLDSLVAPIALFPDPLLGQVLVASTYPLEIVQLSQWLDKNKNLKGSDLTNAVKNQNWDPSVQAMAAFPDVVQNMAQNIGWTNDLGNAFLAQQTDLMNAVQRMRSRAMDAGKLQTTPQQTVQTQTAGNNTVVVIQPANPDVVYVPTYSPEAIWGSPVYPYPPVYYPPGYAVAAGVLSFGIGVAIGAAWGGGGWGWGPAWGHNNIVINNRNTFINHYNTNPRFNGGNRYGGNNNAWQHNPAHRGGAPYGDRATAQRFGGSARGDNALQRQNAARQAVGRGQGTANRFGGGTSPSFGPGGNRGPGAAGGIGAGGRGPGAGAGIGAGGGRGPGAAGGIGAGGRGPAAGGGIGAGGGVGGANRLAPGGMGGDRIGNRQTSRPSPGAFGGGGMGGVGARQSIQRGQSSMGGGGFGGMHGGGMRGGGGGMRGGGMRGGGRRR